MRKSIYLLLLLSLIISMSGCRKKMQSQQTVKEDSVAKQMLQGIWVDEDEQDVAFKAQGDTIFILILRHSLFISKSLETRLCCMAPMMCGILSSSRRAVSSSSVIRTVMR